MLVKINFHPVLQSMTKVEYHIFDITTLSSIKNALIVLFPDLRKYINLIMNRSLKENLCLITNDGKTLNKQDYYLDIIKQKELTLVPLIGGAGGKGMGIIAAIIGIALIATGIGAGGGLAALSAGTFAAETAVLGGILSAGQLISIGISLTLSGLMQMLMKPPTQKSTSSASAESRRNNDLFDALENTTDTNASVQLIYGMTRVAGQMLSGHIETITHGQSDTIYVSDLFYKNVNELTKVEGS